MSETRSNIIADCAAHLGLTLSEVLSIARTAPRRYYVWTIEKRSGGERVVCHPARELKFIQEYLLQNVLHVLPVHAAATAYVKGGSIKKNALSHRFSRVILKLDFADFFNSLKTDNWKKYAARHFQNWSKDEHDFSARILFWGGGRSYKPKCLAIGAPTSPLLSNALMYDFDEKLSEYAEKNELVYTRYADDITLSSHDFLDRTSAISAVRMALLTARYSKIHLNEKKTVLVSKKYARRITGLIITPDQKISLGRDRKRTISSMVDKCRKSKFDAVDRKRLSGLLSFAQDVEPIFVEMLRKKYGAEIIDKLLRGEAELQL